MTADLQEMQQRVLAAAAAMNVILTDAQAGTLADYLAQMQRWNRTYNLTAVRDIDQMVVQHVFDSLAIVAPLRSAIESSAGQCAATVADVGSGGGLPGVVIAVACRDWQIHCIDAVEKKMAFVRQMSGVLHLPNLHAIHGRVESLAPLSADIVVSRAFASLADFAILAGSHVRLNGRLLAMKGREPAEEIETLEQQTNWRVERIDPLQVPELHAQRCLVWMSRQGNP